MLISLHRHFFKTVFLICCFLQTGFNSSILHAQEIRSDRNNPWVDSVYASLNMDQRIAQLLMVRANSVIDSAEIRKIAGWIRNYNLGGLCFFKGGPVRQAILTNYYQSLAATPLLISMDAEWGLGMRLDSTMSFARQMTLGAVQDPTILSRYGIEVAKHLRRLGVHISFSPVADINNNPSNPVINVRSFGESKQEVAERSVLYMKGLQRGGILSVAKHFPGHGDTDTDSHLALPFIAHPASTLDTLELFPFRELIQSGIDGIMTAHLFIPALDSTPNRPSSISPLVVHELLRKKLGFNGVIFTDALDMKGAANFAPPGQLEVNAILAGNDILLLPESVDSAVLHIRNALLDGTIPETVFEDRCKRVLEMKFRAGLDKPQHVRPENLSRDLNSPAADYFNRQLYEKAVTLLKNENNLLPLSRPDTLKIAAITIGYRDETLFQDRLSTYVQMDEFNLPREFDDATGNQLLSKIKQYNLLLVTVNNTHPSPARRFGMSQEGIRLIDTLLASKPAILNLFTLPYAVRLFRNAPKAKAILVSYQDNPVSYDMAAQAIAGGTGIKGKSPVTASESFPMHCGAQTTATRIKYTLPEELGIPSSSLAVIDSIVYEGLNAAAYPGCQVLLASHGKVFFSKAYGYHDYSRQQAVKTSDLYDLASISKVAATTLAVMKLVESKKLDLKKPLSRYLHELENSNKSHITLREVMAHQAGLIAWIPFYKAVIKAGKPDSTIFSSVRTDAHPLRVAEGLYISHDYTEKLLDSIIRSPLSGKKELKYSDLGFILLQQLVEQVTGMPLDVYLEKEFYKPMGLPTMGFRPLERFSPERITPTENDTVFRHQLIHGDVHDPAAALMGGVAGHAGLFSNAADLAALFQMLLDGGKYGGQVYLDSNIIVQFTSRQFPGNRRGLGFDKPQNPGEEGPACADASNRSFGHSGFTGTYVWADPENQFIMVFLSNRVHPDATENKLVKLGIRTRIQQAAYKLLIDSGKQGHEADRIYFNTTLEGRNSGGR